MDHLEVIPLDQLPANRTPADRNPVLIYLARLAPGSRRTQSQALRVIATMAHPGADPLTFPWHALDYQHTSSIRSQLATRYAPATANKMLSALRGVLTECRRLQLMPADQCERARDVAVVRGTRLPKGRALGTTELTALFATCTEPTPATSRDAALLSTLYSGGLRRAEAVALDVADYNVREQSISIRAGKGNKGRIVYLSDSAAVKLGAWLWHCTSGSAVSGITASALFVRIRRGGHITADRLTDQAVRYILLQRCEQAGIAAAAPHDMRRTMISHLLDAGIDISTVQSIAGHSSVSTTQKYDRRGEGRKKRAAQALNL